MLENVKLTRTGEKEIIRDTIIDWMSNDEKNSIIETITNQLNTKQRKIILKIMENAYNTEMRKAAIGLGFIGEESLYNNIHIL